MLSIFPVSIACNIISLIYNSVITILDAQFGIKPMMLEIIGLNIVLLFMNVVNKNLEVRIYPSKVDRNDKGEKIASLDSILSNIGISTILYALKT